MALRTVLYWLIEDIAQLRLNANHVRYASTPKGAQLLAGGKRSATTGWQRMWMLRHGNVWARYGAVELAESWRSPSRTGGGAALTTG